MDSLKNSLYEKLQSSNHLRNDLEALPRGADLITQCEAIDNWYNAWIKKDLETKLQSVEDNGPIFSNKPRHTSSSFAGCDLTGVIHQEARNELFRKRELLCLMPIEVKMLEELLCRNSVNWSPPSLPSSPAKPWHTEEGILIDVPAPLDYLISLQGYQKALSEFSEYLKLTRESNGYLLADSLWVLKWFSTKLFVRLSKNENDGLVQVSSIMEYLFKKLQYYQLRLELMKYDSDGNGYFTKEILRVYLNHQWRNFTKEKHQTPLIKSYIDSIISETFFLLDPHRTSKLKILELLGSRLLPQLRTEFWDGQMYQRFSVKLTMFKELLGNDTREAVPIAQFCEKLPEVSQRIWKSDDRVKEKRLRISHSVLHRLLHLYEASSKGKDHVGISFGTFLDIFYAWEYLGTCFSSICYFFRALDTDDKGYLDETDLQNHYRNIGDILLKMKTRRRRSFSPAPAYNEATSGFSFIKAEIKDLLAKESMTRITPESLYKAKDGHIVIAYLINIEASLNNSRRISW